MIDLKVLLTKTVEMSASDLHLKTGVIPVVRKHGELFPLDQDMKRLTHEQLRDLAYSILPERLKLQLEQMKEVDMGYGLSGVGRFRVNIFKQRGTIQMVFRTISDRVPKMEELGLPDVMEKIAQSERGLVLITGVTGSGKSTTMAAMIDHINGTFKRHIVTIEDPIEFLIRDRRSLVTQRELGMDTESFHGALRAALRQDPDVIMIGEMRDKETIDTALLAAETGHLVISTLHTADAKETINRILMMYEPHKQMQIRYQLAHCLRAIVCMRLAKKMDGTGLIPAVEVMINTTRTRDMIIKPERTSEIIQAIEDGVETLGTQSFDQALMRLLTHKKIDLAEALQLSTNPEDFELRHKGIKSADGGRWSGFDDRTNAQTVLKTGPEIEVEQLMIDSIPIQVDAPRRRELERVAGEGANSSNYQNAQAGNGGTNNASSGGSASVKIPQAPAAPVSSFFGIKRKAK